MFSGFDFKRFSLDALQQDEENEDATPGTPMPTVAERAERPAPPPQKLPPADEEHSEWDWDQDNTTAQLERKGVSKVGASDQPLDEASEPFADAAEGDCGAATATTAVGMSVGAASPAETEQIDGQGKSDAGGPEGTGREGGADNLVAEERDVRVFQEASQREGSNERVSTAPMSQPIPYCLSLVIRQRCFISSVLQRMKVRAPGRYMKPL